MPSYSPSLLRTLTIACCIAATNQAGAQRAEAVGVQAPSDSALMEGALDPCLLRSAACAYPRTVDRCESPTYRAVSRTAAAGAFVGAQAVLWSYFENAWWSGEEAKGFFFRADWDDDMRDQDKFGHFFGGYHL